MAAFQFRGAYRRLIGRDAVVLQHIPNTNVISVDHEDDSSMDTIEIVPNVFLTPIQQDIVSYIAGFVVRKLSKTVKCSRCNEHLIQTRFDDQCPIVDRQFPFDLIDLRDKGGLIKPSMSVFLVCTKAESVIKQLTERDLNDKLLLKRIQMSVLNDIQIPFPNDHETGLDSHSLQLTKHVIAFYAKVRLHHLAQCYTQKVQGKQLRSRLTKTILFSHQ